jgi:DNA polymerase
VCLGATAARALLGPEVRVGRVRGDFLASDLAPGVLVTVHPGSVLSVPDEAGRRLAYAAFVADLGRVAERLRGLLESA